MTLRFSRLALPLVLVTIMALSISSTLAQGMLTGRVQGTVVDGEGNKIGNLKLLFVPDESVAITPVKMKVNKKGRFNHSFFPAGKFQITIDGESDLSVRKVKFELKQEVTVIEAWERDVHPENGLLVPFSGGGKHTLVVTVATPEEKQAFAQDVMIADSKDEMKKLGEFYAAGNMQGVIQEADKLLAKSPDLGRAIFVKGVAQARLEQFDAAEMTLKKAMVHVPNEPQIHGLLGNVILSRADKMSDVDEAKARALYLEADKHLAMQIEKTPDDTEALVNRAAALNGAGDKDQALAMVMQLIEKRPDDPQWHFYLAQHKLNNEDVEGAMQVLDNMPTPDGGAAVMLFNIARDLFNDDKMEMAIMAAKRAEAINPNLADVQRILSRAYISTEQTDLAIQALEKFIELAPEQAEVEKQMLDALKK